MEETKRGITVLEKFDSDQPPTNQNQPPNADILDKVLDQNILYSYKIHLSYYIASSICNISSS